MDAKSCRQGRGLGVALALAVAASACTPKPVEPAARAEALRQPATERQAAPRITSTFQSELRAGTGGPVTLRVVAGDPQARALSIRWSANTGTLGEAVQEAQHSEVQWTPPPCVRAGTTPTITATATNALGQSASTRFTVTGGATCVAGSARPEGSRLLALHAESAVWTRP